MVERCGVKDFMVEKNWDEQSHIEKFMIEKYGVKSLGLNSSWLKNLGLRCPGLKCHATLIKYLNTTSEQLKMLCANAIFRLAEEKESRHLVK